MEYINFEAEDETPSDNEELAFSDNEGENLLMIVIKRAINLLVFTGLSIKARSS